MNNFAEKTAKAELIEYLRKKKFISASTVLLSEYSVNKSQIRADLVLAKAKSLHGFEIKTDLDSLQRVCKQVEGYVRYFTHVTFVVGQRHLSNADRLLPRRIGLWVMDDDGIQVIRNATRIQRKKRDLIQILTVADLRRLSKQLDSNFSANSRHQFVALASKLSRAKLEGASTQSIRERFRKTSSDFLRDFSSCHEVEKILTLSRFIQQRRIIEKQKQKLSQIWNSWNYSNDADIELSNASNQSNHHPLA